VLFEDGSLKLLKIVGDWSHWQGESSGWSIEDEETIQPEEAIRRYGLAKLVDGLAEEFNEATRKLEKLQVNYAKRWELIKKVEEVLQLVLLTPSMSAKSAEPIMNCMLPWQPAG